ncbi:MAG: uroporphyrinogen decarboxylase family protein [Verrucomicrobia bacterium]|nr:uroporphyrinogen decarboxylase family protein [Verrucomicrobiota bacterium]
MNSKERVQAVIEGGIPDRVPVCLHNFLLAAREAGVTMEKYRTDPAAVAKTHLHALEKYGHDCILIDIDTTMIAEAMGARSDATPDEPGHIAAPAIASLDEVDRLRPVDPLRDGRIPVLIEATRLISQAAGDRIAIRTNCDQGPFSLACLLRGNEDFLIDLAENPDEPAIGRLLEVCYASHLSVQRAVKEAGADFTSLGDSFCGPDVISPAMFERFSKPHEERLVRELSDDGIFTVIHICGNTTRIVESLAQYPFCGFELDYKTDAALAKRTAGAGHVLFGNIDPSGIIARGTPEQVREAARTLIEIWKPGGGFILNAGCAIPATTPPQNLRALVDAAEEFGRYDD